MKPERNDPCPCGSGKKYKKCCYLSGQNPKLKNLIKSEDIDVFDEDYEDDFDDDDNNDEVDSNVDDYYSEQKSFITMINNLRRIFLDKKPHIKKYYEIRDMYSEIINTMAKYYHDGKFKKQIDTDSVSEPEPHSQDEGSPLKNKKIIYLTECDFDLNTRAGNQAFYDVLIYKTAPNVSCITDDFLRDRRYRKPEKIELLHSMLDSKLGLFEVVRTDEEEGYAYLRDVFTGDEYKIIDIGLSGNQNNDDIYFYTRIITYQDITFGTGLNFLFEKTDGFIKNYIKQHKKDFNPKLEFARFTQLCNRYSKTPNKIKVITNEI